ncbi:MAG: hypothetical protein Fur0018_04470 [Anaerolineales bacterium]
MKPRRLWLFLALALLNGLAYAFLVPPWQHYDEPSHFEFAWLVAHRPGWPQEEAFDREMRAATLRSMIAHDFFRGMGSPPSPDVDEPWIGPVAQVGNAPLYYALAALPMRLFAPLDVEPQLYAARLVSLALFLATVALAWGTLAVLFPSDSPLRWMPLAFLVALPPFVDIMTAVNDDAAGVAAFALFLFFATRLIRRGWRWGDALGLLLSVGLCLIAKRTVYFAVALFPLVLLFALLRGARRRWAWGLTVLALAGGLLLSLRTGDAALWYRRTRQAESTRVAMPDAPLGAYALRLHLADKNRGTQILQLLPPDQVQTWRGQRLTLGAWMWASAPVDVAAPRLLTIGAPPADLQGAGVVSLTTQPQFFVWTIQMPDAPLRRAEVRFAPVTGRQPLPVDVFVDGALLVVGEFPPDEIPQWQDAGGTTALWGGAPIQNILRNPSGERAWLNPRPWADALWSRVFGYQSENFASLVAYTLRDLPGAGWYYQTAGVTLFRSFWGKFGWAHVSLLGGKPYRALLVISALLLLGGVSTLRPRRFAWDVVLLYGLALSASWGLTLVRGAHHTMSAWVNIPVARYAFPAILPLAVWFSAGAWQAGRLTARLAPPLRRFPGLLWVLFLAGLTLWGWVSVYVFYRA